MCDFFALLSVVPSTIYIRTKCKYVYTMLKCLCNFWIWTLLKVSYRFYSRLLIWRKMLERRFHAEFFFYYFSCHPKWSCENANETASTDSKAQKSHSKNNIYSTCQSADCKSLFFLCLSFFIHFFAKQRNGVTHRKEKVHFAKWFTLRMSMQFSDRLYSTISEECKNNFLLSNQNNPRKVVIILIFW